ncbi:MAG: hypothetical protein KY468_14605 [Armatimonadetes bacterium]|nr:hypothetical protein [Armatimonadota bacterium]
MGDLLRSSLEQPVGPVMAGEVQRYHFVMFLGRTGVAWGILLGGLIATIRWESATGAVEE